jgi:cytoskeletal protein RodZ
MKSLGEYLKKERELRGVTIEEIANITRISSRFIQALENDDFKNLPSDVFVKGFLRAYTKCVGIDPNEVISIYENTRKTDIKPEIKEEASQPLKYNNTAIIALISIIAVILIALGGGIYYYNNSSKGIPKADTNESPELKREIEEQPKETTETREEAPLPQPELAIEQVEEKPITEEDSAKAAPVITTEAIAKTDEPPPVEKKQEPLRLTLTALETVWFSIVIDDAETKEAILQTGEKMIFKANEKFSLTTGNISGTDITLDGVKITLPTTRSNVLKNYILTRGQ